MKNSLFVVLAVFIPTIICNFIPLTRIPPQRIFEIDKRSASGAVLLQGSIGGTAEFYATVSVGSPANSFQVQVDTGSSDLLLYSPSCSSCEGASPYNPSASSSAVLINCKAGDNLNCPQDKCIIVGSTPACGFDDRYGDGSEVTGYVLADKFGVGPFDGFTATFGSILSSNVGQFEPNGVAGIWGLAYQGLSTWNGATVMDNLVSAAAMFNGFSMCLDSGNPIMSIGVDYSGTSGIQWASLTRQLYYEVGLNSVSVGSTTVLSGPGTIIVDSGTTLILLQTNAYQAFENALNGMCSTTSLVGVCNVNNGQSLFTSFCFPMTTNQIDEFPNITVSITGISALTIAPSGYLFPNTINHQTTYCLGVADSQDATTNLLGDSFMQNYHVIFDKHNARVGFGPLSTCPSATSSSSTGIPASGTGYVGGNSAATGSNSSSAITVMPYKGYGLMAAIASVAALLF